MMDFTALPLRLVSLRDLRWPDHHISKDDLSEPHLRREIDDEPVWVEQLISGQHFFVHDGRHRILRALARGEYEIRAHALMNSMRRELDEAQASLADRREAERTDHTLLPLFDVWETEGLPPLWDLGYAGL